MVDGSRAATRERTTRAYDDRAPASGGTEQFRGDRRESVVLRRYGDARDRRKHLSQHDERVLHLLPASALRRLPLPRNRLKQPAIQVLRSLVRFHPEILIEDVSQVAEALHGLESLAACSQRFHADQPGGLAQ